MKASRISTLVILLVAMTTWQGLALADYALNFHVPDQGAVTDVFIQQAFHTSITNTGSSDDTITITMVKNVPADWIYGVSMCVDGECFSPTYLEHTMPLSAGELTNLDVDMTPFSIGEGSVTITVASHGDPGLSFSKVFTILTPGFDVLLVAGDEQMGSDVWYHDAISAAGKTVCTWQRQEMGSLSNEEISLFDNVVWESGTVDGGLTNDDLGTLTYYILHGGNLFLSGQNLAYDYCNTASPHYTPSTKSWFNTILKTDYASAEGPGDSASGVEGDMVTGDLSFNLYGGDGANNNTTMDALTTLSGGVATLQYGSGNTAANRCSYGSGKAFFCAFAFEGIDTEANRSDLMNQALLWFAGQITPVNDIVAPLLAKAPFATPNPFNPQTSIRFDVGGTETVPAEVTIFNLKGQIVRHLLKGTISPGPQNLVWNGRGNDGRNLATGIYMARVMIADQSKTVKMTLVK